MKITDGWVEAWHGEDPSVPGKLLDDAGIEMRIAAKNWGAHGGGSLLNFFRRRRPESQLLVKAADSARARDLLQNATKQRF